MYVKRSNKSFLILSLHINDILMDKIDIQMLVKTKEWLYIDFDMKDISEVDFVFEIKVCPTRSFIQTFEFVPR